MTPQPLRRLWFDRVRLPDRYASGIGLEVDAAGRIAAITSSDSPPVDAEHFAGLALPGMPNLHGHGFQFVLAGTAERPTPGRSDFWTWRTRMYELALGLDADAVEAIAEALALDLLLGGYTGSCEFHYLHHAPDGTPYADPNELALRITDATTRVGLPITMLPALYQHSGFGKAEPTTEQRRFVRTTDVHLAAIEALQARFAERPDVRIGLAIHSLRAVGEAALQQAIDGLDRIAPRAPIHVHIAEQTGEVDDCLAATGQRPIAWLLDHAPVDERFCLVHATHADAEEIRRTGACGAIIGACPQTEADLGDGILAADAYLRAGAQLGIGSDQHVSTNAAGEIRMLEYSQRLRDRRRTVLTDGIASPAEHLWLTAAAGGAHASGRGTGRIEVGAPADLVVLATDTPRATGLRDAAILDLLVFAPDASHVRDVIVGGHPVIRDRQHERQDEIRANLRMVMARVRAAD